MNRYIQRALWLAFAGLPTLLNAQTPYGVPGTWTSTFNEDFASANLDGDKWRVGEHWAGMNGASENDPAMLSVSGGIASLKSQQRSWTFGGVTRSYASTEISTFKTFRQQYGYFEARVKFPAVTGVWPAFWLMPDRGNYGNADNYQRSYLKFDLTGFSGTVTSASLKLTASAANGSTSNNVLVMKLRDDSWTEGTLTWNNAPAPDPAWIKQHWGVTYSVGTQISTDVLGFVQEKVAGNKKVSFVLADTFMRVQLLKFYSSEYATQASRPQLIVNGVTYYATEDAYIQGGTQADLTHGTGTDLCVREDYADCSSTYNGGMEFDIMESLGIDGANTTYHTMHWDGYGADHQSISSGLKSFASTPDGYHIYGLYWQNGVAEYYIDGVQTWTWNNSRIANVPAYMLVSMQLGGWNGNNAGAQVNNQIFEVDYVRAWSGTRLQGALLVDQTSSQFVYAPNSETNWTTYADANDHGGNHRTAKTNGASVTISFTGVQAKVIGIKANTCGIASVTLDGVSKPNIDLYNSTLLYQQAIYDTGVLAYGNHTIVLARTGTKNASSTDYKLPIDALLVMPGVVDQTSTAFAFSPNSETNWTTYSDTNDYGGSHRTAYTNGASVSISFTGTRAKVLAIKAATCGIASVTLDGVSKPAIDLYNSATVYQQTVYDTGVLTSGNHTIILTRSGTKNASATDYKVPLDALIVTP